MTAKGHFTWRHGTNTGYHAHKCRCPECTAAATTYERARRQKRRGLPRGQRVRDHDDAIDTLLAVLHGYY